MNKLIAHAHKVIITNNTQQSGDNKAVVVCQRTLDEDARHHQTNLEERTRRRFHLHLQALQQTDRRQCNITGENRDLLYGQTKKHSTYVGPQDAYCSCSGTMRHRHSWRTAYAAALTDFGM